MGTAPFDLQGHRGARGLKPENTLPAFEAAFDAGVTSVEADLHLTRDGVPVVIHDPCISDKIARRLLPGAPEPASRPWISQLSLAELRCYRADLNPEAVRFPAQDAEATLLGRLFADSQGLDVFAIPTLADVLAFAAAYAGEPGRQAGKTDSQRAGADKVRFDLELKRVPFRPERIGDSFAGQEAGLLERAVLEVLRQADAVRRVNVRSFDHRSVRAIRAREPTLTTAVLIAGTAPVDPAHLVKRAGARVYCPEYHFLDAIQVRQLHAENIRVLPWTVNDPDAWQRLCDWGVDGITTDFPDRLAAWLRARNVGWPPTA
jgi:glycerophosphoryl diester phosphodiesterase